MESEDVRRWVGSLQMSRVTRWGGMISTPDAVLQTVIKRALIECGCPPSIVNDLMENSHERRWPPGLATLEARQHNRRVYESYVCKRIPGQSHCRYSPKTHLMWTSNLPPILREASRDCDGLRQRTHGRRHDAGTRAGYDIRSRGWMTA